MGNLNEEEFERRLFAAGQQLANPPRSMHGMLRALGKVEAYLSMVRSPSESIFDAMGPAMDALATPRFTRNRYPEVRLQVLHCLSKITKITVPDHPYDNDRMKDVLDFIVKSFKDLGKMNSPSFAIRVSVLKTVAEVRLCVIMVNLGMNELIIEMFEYLFSAVSENPYSEDVHASMQTIMTAILDESDDISQELLSVLRRNLTTEMEESSPAAHKLARNVVASCARSLHI
jgi:hypothetical protein